MALTCHDLQVGYAERALGVAASLSFAPGLHALVGRNGAGKSTFLKTLAQLIPALTGDVRWQGHSLVPLSAMARARIVTWLPAEESIPFAYEVEDILIMGRYPWHGGRPTATDRERAASVLSTLGAPFLAGRRIDHLSTGERQLVRLGRALMSEAPVWLWDEPLRGLDCHHQIMVLSLLRAAAQRGQVVLITMHELEWAQRLADDFLVFGLPESPLGLLSPQDFASPALWERAFLVQTSPRQGGSRPGLDIKLSF